MYSKGLIVVVVNGWVDGRYMLFCNTVKHSGKSETKFTNQ